MSRIETSDGYYGSHKGGKMWNGQYRFARCPIGLEDCQRMYCSEHRLLYRECDTAIEGTEGDRDVINGTRTVIEVSGECPKCESAERVKRFEREIVERAWQETKIA